MSDNGVIRIGREGVKKFAFGAGPEFELDVVRVWDLWVEQDESFRDIDGKLLKDKRGVWRKSYINFPRNIILELGKEPTCPMTTAESEEIVGSMSDAQCLAFMTRLGQIVDGLKDFFDGGTGSAPLPVLPLTSDTLFTE